MDAAYSPFGTDRRTTRAVFHNVTYTTIDGLKTSGDYDDDPLFVSDPEDCDSNGWFDPPCTGNGDCPSGSPDDCDDYDDLELTTS